MKKDNINTLTTGSLARGFISFLMPLLFGQLLQQLYNIADSLIIGNFADNASFAAVSSCGNLCFLIVGFFMGLSNGAGVVISRFYGANNEEGVSKAIQNTFFLGIITSIVVTIITTLLAPKIIIWMDTPASVQTEAITYFRVYCMGISTIIMYNLLIAIMRALGDSMMPLIFLLISSVLNIVLDLFFVAVLHQGTFGAAFATVIAQGVAAVLCYLRMQRKGGLFRINLKGSPFNGKILKQIILQGLPSGIQNSALSIGNVVIQTYINSFGEYAMSGQGAHIKIEGFVFIPILSISMALSTMVSQNRGAGNYQRIRKGVKYSIISSVIIAQVIGAVIYICAPQCISLFTKNPDSIAYGVTYARTVTIFYFLLAFTHAASGIMLGMEKAMYSMVTFLSTWCILRVAYTTIALHISHTFVLLALAYPITWASSSVIFLVTLLKQMKKLPKGGDGEAVAAAA